MTLHAPPAPSTTVLVVGANGFLAGFVVAALHAHGHRVLRGVRVQGRAPMPDERDCDLARMDRPEQWRDALRGVDAVVNVAGILRESRAQTFEAVHVAAPLALAQACVAAGIARFVQISALGRPEDGEFVASKHRFDEALQRLPLQAVVLRPSVVYSAAGSYGGTSLLRALAGFPLRQCLPGDGRWPIQPLAAEDLAELAVRALRVPASVYEVGGPERMSLRDYQQRWRRWLRVPGTGAWRVPEACVSVQANVFEWLGRGPVGTTMWRMLRRGNVTAPDAVARLEQAFGMPMRTLDAALAQRPSQTQDRWHAQLYFLAPALRATLVALWLLSAWVGLALPAERVDALVAGTVLANGGTALARGGGAVDLVLACWLASGWHPRAALSAMALCVVAYTVVLGAALPGAWLDPFGGLAKNLVVLPALAVAWVLADRR
jgi:uncharacterized protein YbjT (DUF2867 family)